MRDEQREAFERFCREEYPNVVRAAYLITGDCEEALDVAQEAFVRSYQRWRQVSTMNAPAWWVTKVAANLAISWRRRQRLRRREGGDAGTVLAALDPEPVGDDVMAALATLTPAQRTVVVLRLFADQSVDQTATALGKRPGTVRALTSQAMSLLREFFDVEEVNDDARR